jgi:signal transduction histidine kinase
LARVLVVDDDPDIVESCIGKLQREGYEVVGLSDPVEAMRRLAGGDVFDCLLVDLRMPVMDGGTFLERSVAYDPDVVPIVMTAYASIETALESARKGAWHFLTKPFTSPELMRAVEDSVERTALRREARKLRQERDSGVAALARERSRSRTVLQSLSDGVLVVGRDGRVLMDNPALARVLGGGLLRKASGPFEDVVAHDGLKDLIRRSLADADASILMRSAELEIDGRDYLVRITRIVDDADADAGFVFALSDITEMRRVEQIKTRFVTMAARELMAPLETVEASLSLFTDPDIPLSEDKRLQLLGRVKQKTEVMRHLVENLLTLNRAPAEWTGGRRERFDVAGLLEDAINLAIGERGDRDIVLRREYLDHTAHVLGDGDELVRMFAELIGNAFRYNRDGGEVRVILFAGEQVHEVRVADTGVGIPENRRESIFEEFVRVKGPSTVGITGAGLGLSVARRIAESHFGTIRVESRAGEGSVFSVFLPASNQPNSVPHR